VVHWTVPYPLTLTSNLRGFEADVHMGWMPFLLLNQQRIKALKAKRECLLLPRILLSRKLAKQNKYINFFTEIKTTINTIRTYLYDAANNQIIFTLQHWSPLPRVIKFL